MLSDGATVEQTELRVAPLAECAHSETVAPGGAAEIWRTVAIDGKALRSETLQMELLAASKEQATNGEVLVCGYPAFADTGHCRLHRDKHDATTAPP